VGDDPVASRNEYLGLVEYELPPTIPVRTPVVVQFNYDRDRILKVRVKIEGTDVDYEVTPKRHAPDPGAAKAGKWRVAIQNAIASRRSMIEEYGEFMEPEQKRMLEDDMRRAQDALRDQDATTGHQALVKLQETTFSLEIASRLWLVDRLVYDVEPKTAQALAELSKNLRDAYRAKDAGQVNRLRRALDSAINSVLESLKLPTDGILPDLLERISVTERAGAPRS
jgi:molecular chaperone DnaK (HSP70)